MVFHLNSECEHCLCLALLSSLLGCFELLQLGATLSIVDIGQLMPLDLSNLHLVLIPFVSVSHTPRGPSISDK